MVALTNFEIEDICKQMQLPIVGVYSKDKLPEKRYIGSYYVNLEDHNAGGGSHWVFMIQIIGISKIIKVVCVATLILLVINFLNMMQTKRNRLMKILTTFSICFLSIN